MYIKRINADIPASFNIDALDAEGNWIEGTINIKVNRLSFREVSSDAIEKAMANADKDPTALGNLLAKCVTDWDVFNDEACQEKLEITCDNIIDQPAAFVMRMSEATIEALIPNRKRASNSPDGSEQTEKLASVELTLSSDTVSPEPVDTGA